MATSTSIFQWEVEGQTLILTPLTDLEETEYRQVEQERRNILRFLKRTATNNIVMDFSEADYIGSIALDLFLQVWKVLRRRHGHMAVCVRRFRQLEATGQVIEERKATPWFSDN